MRKRRQTIISEIGGAAGALLCGGRIPMTSLVQTLAVAEYLSFHHAALALGTSQSSVSTQIKGREADLGIVLFDRNARGVRLTEAGRRFVDQVDDAMGILDRLLERLHGRHPKVRLNITEGTGRDTQLMMPSATGISSGTER